MTNEHQTAEWAAGAVYAFATHSRFSWEQGATGRFAALKVVEWQERNNEFAVVALAPVFDHLPVLTELTDAPVLRNNRFTIEDQPVVRRLQPPARADLASMEFLGTAAPSSEELELAQTCDYSATLTNVLTQAEAEWRWANERSKFEADTKRMKEERSARIAALDAHYESRLKGLTFETLLTETPFEKWDGPPPYPPAPFTKDARAQVLAAVADLDALGSRPGKRATRAIIRNLVEWFNAADESAQVIETSEREDICEVIAEMLHIAKQPTLMDEVHEWRSW